MVLQINKRIRKKIENLQFSVWTIVLLFVKFFENISFRVSDDIDNKCNQNKANYWKSCIKNFQNSTYNYKK